LALKPPSPVVDIPCFGSEADEEERAARGHSPLLLRQTLVPFQTTAEAPIARKRGT
jgi:hypothetical protein